jgi:hypothetical protein
MRALLPLLWLPGSFKSRWPPRICSCLYKLNYCENLSRVSLIIGQIFVVHSVYIVGMVLLFAALTFGFAGDLASGHGLGRPCNVGFTASALFLSAAYWRSFLRPRTVSVRRGDDRNC